jgi:hypothetical protein
VGGRGGGSFERGACVHVQKKGERLVYCCSVVSCTETLFISLLIHVVWYDIGTDLVRLPIVLVHSSLPLYAYLSLQRHHHYTSSSPPSRLLAHW